MDTVDNELSFHAIAIVSLTYMCQGATSGMAYDIYIYIYNHTEPSAPHYMLKWACSLHDVTGQSAKVMW